MNKLEKAYNKLNTFERAIVDRIYQKLFHRDFYGLKIKKLQGHADLFRVRKGRVRIIYRDLNGIIEVVSIDLRDSKTYKNL